MPDVHVQVAVVGQAVGVGDVDDDAVRVLAGEHRLLLAEQLVAHSRPDAVGADDEVGGHAVAVGEGEGRGVAVVDDRLEAVVEVHHALGEGADEGVDEVSAVDEARGEAVGVGLGPVLERDALARRGVDLEARARRGDVLDHVEDAPLAEAVERRRAQADAAPTSWISDACSYR